MAERELAEREAAEDKQRGDVEDEEVAGLPEVNREDSIFQSLMNTLCFGWRIRHL
jgi:hypothetical protein